MSDFMPHPWLGLARKTDPHTSKEAAAKSAEFAPKHADRIVHALKTHGPRTAKELEQIIGLTVVQIDRRTSELERSGRIKAATTDGMPRTKTNAISRDGCLIWEFVK